MSFKDVLRRRHKKNQRSKALEKFCVYDIIKKPVLTEKTYKQIGGGGKDDKDKHAVYTFVVASDANKNDIKIAIKKLYNVDVVGVRTIRVPDKGRAQRLVRRGYKKAIVTLQKGQKIELI